MIFAIIVLTIFWFYLLFKAVQHFVIEDFRLGLIVGTAIFLFFYAEFIFALIAGG